MSVSSIVVTNQHGVLSKLPFYANQKKQYKIKLADIIRQIDVVSSQSLADMYRNGITTANLGSNVSAIGISCFADCRNLTNISVNPYALDSRYPQQLNSFKRVEESAFTNCKALTSVSFLDESNKTNPKGMQILDYIGQEAFANTGLTAAYVPLRRETGETFIMPSAFANCQKLKHAENVMFNYLGPYEFANCRNLTSVKMTDYHAYSYECTFKDCVSLKHVDIPAKLWKIGDNMFEGCTHLTSVTFLDSPDNKSELSGNKCYGNFFLSGTSVTSLTFPSCVVDWTPFNTYTLSGMSKLKRIKFNGIPFKKLGIKITNRAVEFDTHHLIMNDSDMYNKFIEYGKDGKIGTYSCDIIKNMKQYLSCTPFDENTIESVINKGCPIIAIRTNIGCGNCNRFDASCLIRKEFLDWLRDVNDKCIFFVSSPSKLNLRLLEGNTNPVLVKGSAFPGVYGVWKDANKDYHYFEGGDQFNADPATMNKKVKQFLKGFNAPVSNISVIVKTDILSSAVFGLGHSVVLESRDGQTISVDGNFMNTDLELLYQREEVVDRHTGAKGTNTSKFFKFGQWYYNVKQLREVADKYHIPMFVEVGSLGCQPCEEFGSMVYQNTKFQNFMKDSKILLCRTVSYSSGWPGQSGYSFNWTGQFGNPPYNDRGRMPIMFLYWNSLSADKNLRTGEYLQGEKYQFASFNTAGESTDSAFPIVHNWEEITSLISQVSSEWQLSTVAQQVQQVGASLTAFNKPSIKHHKDKKLKNWYNSYRFDESDTYGAYYPVKLFDNVKASYTVYLSVGNDSAASYTLNPYDHSTHANYNAISGIYQYFTMPYPGEDAAESAIANFKATYDISGILFSIGPSTKQTLSNSMTYSYRSKTLDAFRSSYQLTASKIASQSWSYLFTDVYAHDSWSGDPIEPITIVPDYFDNGQKTYNAVYECKTKNLAYSKVVVFISGDVKVSNKEIVYENNDDEHLYVVSAYFYKTTTDSESKLQWLSAFTNAGGYDPELE